MKGLFQCPPWARSFCPFRACGAYMRNFSKYISLEFVLRKYAGVKYCFLIIAISVFSI